MKVLILITLLTLVSCGKKRNNSTAIPVSSSITIQNTALANCNMQAVRNNCTNIYIANRLLQRIELYNHYCWRTYRQCVGVR